MKGMNYAGLKYRLSAFNPKESPSSYSIR